jgi:hypothetical protein
MIWDSIADPSVAARTLLALQPPPGRVVEAAILVSVLDALIVGILTNGALQVPLPQGELTLAPLAHAALLAISFVLSASALQVGGKVLGGKGSFGQSLLVIVWLEVIAIALQLVQLVAAFLLAPLAPFLGLAALVVLLWCLVHFVRVLHGFSGYGATILTILLGSILLVLGLTLTLGLLGIGVPANV